MASTPASRTIVQKTAGWMSAGMLGFLMDKGSILAIIVYLIHTAHFTFVKYYENKEIITINILMIKKYIIKL